MQNLDFKDSLVVGVDVHKASNTAVLITPFCEQLASYEFSHEEEDLQNFYDQVRRIAKGNKVYYALEDTEGKGFRLSRYLKKEGCEVYAVPPIYTERERRRSTHLEKTDIKDAKRVAEVLLKKSDKLPKVMISKKTEEAKQLKELMADRNELIRQRTRIKNQLHEILNQVYGNKYKDQVSYKDIFCVKAINEWKKILRRENGYREERASRRIKMLELINEEVKLIEREVKNLSKKNEDVQLLKTMKGIGDIIAAEMIGEIKDIRKFRSPGALARYSGIAPREHESGKYMRYYTDFRGNRNLNKVFHKLVLSLIGVNGVEKSRRYYKRKIREGKSKLHAMRCLKRRLVDIVYCMLKNKTPYSLLEKELKTSLDKKLYI
jgi:transposase